MLPRRPPLLPLAVALLLALALAECGGTAQTHRAAATVSSSDRGMGTSAANIPHAAHSWDYSPILGEESGWWAMWYPTCTMPFQSPVSIDMAGVQDALDMKLVVRPVNGQPMTYLDATVVYNSTFNSVRCHFGATKQEVYIYWDDGSVVEDKDRVVYRLSQFTVRFPSEHEIDGEMQSVELRYTFEPPNKWPLDEETVIDDVIDDKTIVAISILLKETPDFQADPLVERLFKQMLSGYSSGSASVRAYIPPFEHMYEYKGSQTTPPCRGNVRYFIGTQLMPIGASTLKRLRSYGPNWKDYRLVKPLAGRVVRRVTFQPEGLVPVFRTTPSPVRYRMEPAEPLYRSVALYYAAVELALLCVLLICVILFMLYQRWTYTPPYNHTWNDPNTKREVFGVPVRYGRETGAPKLREVPRIIGGGAGAAPVEHCAAGEQVVLGDVEQPKKKLTSSSDGSSVPQSTPISPDCDPAHAEATT